MSDSESPTIKATGPVKAFGSLRALDGLDLPGSSAGDAIRLVAGQWPAPIRREDDQPWTQ